MKQTSPSVIRIAIYGLVRYSITITAILIGFISQLLYWVIYDSFGRAEKRASRKIKSKTKLPDDEHYIIIIGTGFSGLGTAIKLNQLGVDNYIILERHGHIGGTWYVNKYPGCACDVPSNLYSFSFEQNPRWSHYYSRQPEIAAYLENIADKYNIRRHVRFNTNVTQMNWIADRKVWQITTESRGKVTQYTARIVVAATGALSTAALPRDIPGIDKFKGRMCHTSAWDNTIDFANKRVAVVGTGASAIQVVPEIANMDVSKLFVFQRTPPWVIPRDDRRVSNFEKSLFEYFPSLQNFIRRCLYWSRETVVLSFAYRWSIRHISEELVKYNLNSQVKDLELRRKVTPTWDLGCKRVLITSDWYAALQKPKVNLITDRIQQVTENSIMTQNGDEYPVDIIIWSTGFETQRFTLPIYGVDGCSLVKQWSNTLKAYRGMVMPNFPNLFLLLGPNSRLGHSSVIIMLEAQLRYVVETLLYVDKNNVQSFSIKQDVHDQYNNWIQSKLKKSVWYLGGCHSWYQNVNGTVTTIWPEFTWKYQLLLKKFDYQNYILTK